MRLLRLFQVGRVQIGLLDCFWMRKRLGNQNYEESVQLFIEAPLKPQIMMKPIFKKILSKKMANRGVDANEDAKNLRKEENQLFEELQKFQFDSGSNYAAKSKEKIKFYEPGWKITRGFIQKKAELEDDSQEARYFRPQESQISQKFKEFINERQAVKPVNTESSSVFREKLLIALRKRQMIKQEPIKESAQRKKSKRLPSKPEKSIGSIYEGGCSGNETEQDQKISELSINHNITIRSSEVKIIQNNISLSGGNINFTGNDLQFKKSSPNYPRRQINLSRKVKIGNLASKKQKMAVKACKMRLGKVQKSERQFVLNELIKLNANEKDEQYLRYRDKQFDKNRRRAMAQYLNLVKFQEKGFYDAEHEAIKKGLLEIIRNQPIYQHVNGFKDELQKASMQNQIGKQQKIDQNEGEEDNPSQLEGVTDTVGLNQSEQILGQTRWVNKAALMKVHSDGRRITRNLVKTDQVIKKQFLKAEIINLRKQKKLTPKPARGVLNPLNKQKIIQKISSTIKRPKPPKPPKLKSRMEYQFGQFQNIDGNEVVQRRLNFQTLILSNLPCRNPIVKHEYNSERHQIIDYTKQIKSSKMYYLSHLLEYRSQMNKIEDILRIKCNGPAFSFIEESIRSTKHCRNLVKPPDCQIKKIKLKRNFEYTNKKILILDIDETLVHSQSLNQQAKKDIFPFHFDFEKTTRHYCVRSYAKEFIKNMAEKYYIVAFTSAVQGYADNILQHLDPGEKYIQHRLYRNHCYLFGESYPYIKDLRILNRDLSQVLIVDNSLYAYWFQIDNGIPILPFVGEQDFELKRLQQYLLKLERVDDVREVNRRMFHMHLYQEADSSTQLLKDYCKLLSEELKSFQMSQ